MNPTAPDLDPHPPMLGILQLGNVVTQLAHTASIRQIDAADLTTFTDDQWRELAGAALDVSNGTVRLGVIRALGR